MQLCPLYVGAGDQNSWQADGMKHLHSPLSHCFHMRAVRTKSQRYHWASYLSWNTHYCYTQSWWWLQPNSQEIYLLNSRKVHNNFHNKNIHNKTLLVLLTHGQLWIFTSTQLRCGSTFLIEKKYCISNTFQETNWPSVVFQCNREWVFVAGFQVTLNWTLKVIVSSKGNYVMPQK